MPSTSRLQVSTSNVKAVFGRKFCPVEIGPQNGGFGGNGSKCYTLGFVIYSDPKMTHSYVVLRLLAYVGVSRL